MTKRIPIALLLQLVIVFSGAPGFAQEQKVAGNRPPGATQLMVEVTVSRNLGGKVLSSAPYTLAVTPGERASLRMGDDTPVPATASAPGLKEDANAKSATPTMSYGYRLVGTSIDVISTVVQDGQYRFLVTIDESSIHPSEPPATNRAVGAPAIRNFRSTNAFSMRDGQNLEYSLATDPRTGEVYRLGVKLSVEK